MKKIVLIAMLILMFASVTYSSAPYKSITVDATTGGVPIAVAGGHPSFAMCVLSTAPIRWTYGNPVPTSSVGMPMYPGEYIILESNEDIEAFRAIRTGSTSGVLDCIIK